MENTSPRISKNLSSEEQNPYLIAQSNHTSAPKQQQNLVSPYLVTAESKKTEGSAKDPKKELEKKLEQEKLKQQKEKEKAERKERERIEKEKEKELLVNRTTVDLPKEQEKQMKDYCQLCFKEFGIFTFRYHCRTCGRSCCNDCSLQVKVRQSTSIGMGGSYRICEFCDIKNENPQLEDYYRLECSLRQSDQEIVVEKIKWLKKTSKELEKQIAHEREDVSLLQASSKRQIEEVQQKIDGLNKDKQRLEKLKEQLLKNNEETNIEIKAKELKIKELQNKRTQKLIDLDKMKQNVEGAEKELRDLIKEIGKYDDNFRSVIGSEIGGNDRSMSNELLYVDLQMNHSIDNPKLILDDKDDGMEVYFQFEQPQEDKKDVLSRTEVKKQQ